MGGIAENLDVLFISFLSYDFIFGIFFAPLSFSFLAIKHPKHNTSSSPFELGVLLGAEYLSTRST